MEKKKFDPQNMSIDIRIDCQLEEEMKMILEALQEKFPQWKFDRQEAFVLYRKDDPEQRQGHTSFTAKAWINKEEQIKE